MYDYKLKDDIISSNIWLSVHIWYYKLEREIRSSHFGLKVQIIHALSPKKMLWVQYGKIISTTSDYKFKYNSRELFWPLTPLLVEGGQSHTSCRHFAGNGGNVGIRDIRPWVPLGRKKGHGEKRDMEETREGNERKGIQGNERKEIQRERHIKGKI